MAPEALAEGLAATFYAATLTPNPNLDPDSDADARAAYQAKGRALASTLLTPQRRASIRCPCASRATRPDRPARVIATVHDRNLLVVRASRGYVDQGLRLTHHFLIDLPLAGRDGFTSVSVWCFGCGALHELGFRWLQRAPRNQESTPCEQLAVAPWGQPVTPQGYTPRHPNDPDQMAFARTTGPLHTPNVVVTLPSRRAFDYRDHFGFHPPHEDHLLRLVAAEDPRLQEPGVVDMLVPQWRRLELDPEERAEVAPEGPLPPEELHELAAAVRQFDPDERKEFLLTIPYMLEPQDFATLKQLLTEEPQ